MNRDGIADPRSLDASEPPAPGEAHVWQVALPATGGRAAARRALREILGAYLGVEPAAVELTDSRYAERFTRFPLRHIYRDLFGMIPAQMRAATGEIRIPDAAKAGDYDLVVIGSPTWWMRTATCRASPRARRRTRQR